MDRATGNQVLVPLVNHRLNVAIPGGSAELYKYNEGAFIVPEPGALMLLTPLLLHAAAKRQRRRGS